MAETDFPDPSTDPPRKRQVSWVWLMPILAIVISGVVVWQTWRNQGPIISVAFPIASGIEAGRSEEHTSELQSLTNLVCRLLLEKKKIH